MKRVDRDLKAIKKVGDTVLTVSEGDKRYQAKGAGGGSGDMAKATYDTDNDGVVDNAEALGGQPGSHYLDRANHTGSQAQSTVTNLVTDLAGKAPYGVRPGMNSVMKPAATLWVSNGWTAAALGTAAQVADRHVIAPFVPAYDMTIDQVGISVSTLLAGSNCKVTIFDSDADGRPTTLLRESGNLSAAAVATVTIAITSLALTAGKVYWIGVRSSGTQTLRTLPVNALPVLSITTASTPVIQGTLSKTETFANAAANWTYASSQHNSLVMPQVLLRVA